MRKQIRVTPQIPAMTGMTPLGISVKADAPAEVRECDQFQDEPGARGFCSSCGHSFYQHGKQERARLRAARADAVYAASEEVK